MIDSGVTILSNLRDQRSTLKGAHTKLLDLANTLGMSNTVLRLIERRAKQDWWVFFVGVCITLIIIYFVVSYLA